MRAPYAGAPGLRPPLLHRITERQIRWFDRCVAVLFFFTTIPTITDAQRAQVAGIGALVVLAAGASLPMAFRRRAPGPVLAVTTACVAALNVRGWGLGATPILVVPMFQVASVFERRRSLRWLAGVVVVAFASVAIGAHLQTTSHESGSIAIFAIAAWFAGDSVRVRREYTEGLADQAMQRSREEIERAERSVVEERLQIARELHDVIAHTLSVVAVQSGMGRHVIDAQPEDAKRALQAIEETSRSALGELRRMLGSLRQDDTPAALAPAPGVRDLPDLAAQIRGAGVPVRLSVDVGRFGPLAPAMDLSVYRIVQEALTNVVKHAGPQAAALVEITNEGGDLVVQVTDDGVGAGAHSSDVTPGSQHGIVGMRERVGVYGGSVRVGPKDSGGFAVTARIPVAGDEEPSR